MKTMLQRLTQKPLFFLNATLLVAIAVTSLAGCGKSDSDSPATPQSPAAVAASQAKAIQDNTSMPPEAKAAAMQQIQAHNASGAYLRGDKK